MHASRMHARERAHLTGNGCLSAFSRDRQEARIRSEQAPQGTGAGERSDAEDAQLHDRILRLTEKARASLHAGIPHAVQ